MKWKKIITNYFARNWFAHFLTIDSRSTSLWWSLIVPCGKVKIKSFVSIGWSVFDSKKRLINELLHIATQKRSIGREFCAVFWGQSLICCHLVLQSQVDLWIEKKTTLLDSSSFHKSNYLLDPQDFPNKGAWMIFKKASNLPASYGLSRYRHAILKG